MRNSKAQANWKDPALYDRARKDTEGFWSEMAQSIEWFKPWDRVLEWNLPSAEWFVGAELNVGLQLRGGKPKPG